MRKTLSLLFWRKNKGEEEDLENGDLTTKIHWRAEIVRRGGDDRSGSPEKTSRCNKFVKQALFLNPLVEFPDHRGLRYSAKESPGSLEHR